MKIIGLTGTVGSGKTTVAELLKKKYHCYVIYSDEVARQLMEPGQISYRLIVENFGSDILDIDKKIDRQKLAIKVFHDSQRLAELNSYTHPYVEEAIQRDIERIRKSKQYKFIVVETALLFQVNYDRFCDEVWVVIAEDRIRRQRLKIHRGYNDQKIDAILGNQMTDEELRTYTTKIIENSGDINNIDKQIQNMLECL